MAVGFGRPPICLQRSLEISEPLQKTMAPVNEK